MEVLLLTLLTQRLPEVTCLALQLLPFILHWWVTLVCHESLRSLQRDLSCPECRSWMRKDLELTDSISSALSSQDSTGSNWTPGVLPHQTSCYPYDSSTLYNPYGDRYSGMDSAARRKNATRETTNTLKAWLYEHRKNPYPTKGEKIMLAIITKMTLTQVSWEYSFFLSW